MRSGAARRDVVLVDEDLHRFDSSHRAALWQAGTPLVALVREPQDLRWRVCQGCCCRSMPRCRPCSTRSTGPHMASEHHESQAEQGAQDGDDQPGRDGPAKRLQVLALWAGRGHAGSTLLAISTAAILGSAAPTVLVDLDATGAAVGVHLDDGHQGRIRSTLADLMNGDLDSHESWQPELDRALQPLGPFARYGQVLCGCRADASA